MKKLISVLLVLVMIFGLSVPAFAYVNVDATRSQIPVIRISGDGDTLCDGDGNEIFSFHSLGTLFGDEEGEDDGTGSVYSSIANVLQSFLVDGILTNNWDPYYENLQKEMSELLGDAILDKNGNPVNGTGITDARKAELAEDLAYDPKESKGYYSFLDYYFWYDWRIDPLESADELYEYINGIKAVTNSDEVSIISSCLGTNVVLAYLAKYGTEGIHGIAFDGTVCNGAEILSESISGKFRIEGNALVRVLEDSNYLGWINVDEFVIATIDLLEKSGTLDLLGISMTSLYNKLVEGVTSALALSTFYTWPNYWAAVSTDDYETALNYVFGEEGSAKREEYAGLIEKLDNYDKLVRQNIEEIMLDITESGANIAIMSKYGYQILPVCQSADALSDQFASVGRSSFGATTSTIYGTLTDEYIASRVEAGYGKYISPDKQVDASTCLYPDYTWFIKGATHSKWTSYEMKILYDVVTADKQLTVDDFEYSQFIVYDNENDKAEPMTEENCNTYVWKTEENGAKPTSFFQKIVAYFKSIITWFKLLFSRIFGSSEATA